KDDFLAMISHKLRTPLNAMLGWAWVLQRQTGGAEAVSRAAEIIERNARAQVRLGEGLLEASRGITRKLRLEGRTMEIAPLIASAYDSLCPAAEAKGVELRLKIDPQAGIITGDPDRLHQVVWNLVSNAIRFTPAGGHVEVGAECAGGDLWLTVSDTGKGISAEVLPLVFDRFRHGRATGGERACPTGLGLGLAMVRRLVEMHGGSVSASSPGEGRGATFTVKLPMNAASAEQEGETMAEWEIEGQAMEGTRVWGKWERNGVDLPVSPSPRLPASYAPARASRGVAAGGGC